MPTLKLGSTTALTESSGALTINVANPTVTLGSNATFPAGHVIRSFYDESDAVQQTLSSGEELIWDELELTITGTNSTSDYLQIHVHINGLFNNTNATAYAKVGLRYSINSWSSPAAGTQLGTVEYYDRPGYFQQAVAVTDSCALTIRVLHPVTGTYKIRPKIRAMENSINVNQSDVRSTMAALEIKG